MKMQFGLSVAFLLLLVTGAVTVKGSDLSDNSDPSSHKAAVQRAKRGFSIYDMLRGKGATSVGPKAPKPTTGTPQTDKPAEGNGFGFNLEDALRPAAKPTGKPSGGDCQGNVVQKLSTVIENQNQQLRLLLQLMARSPSSRFN